MNLTIIKQVLLLWLGISTTIQAQKLIAPQTFEIHLAKDTLIQTSKGTQIWIPAFSFNTQSIDSTATRVKLSVEEAFEKDEMVLSNLTTETNKNILISNGMINLTAELDGQVVNLLSDKQLRISLPTRQGVDEQMNLFSQNQKNGEWIKQEREVVYDSCTIEIKEIIYDYREVSRKEYKKWKRETPEDLQPKPRLFGGKTIELFKFRKKRYYIPIPMDTIWGCVAKDTAYYKFDIQSMGWYNIDKLLRVKKPVSVKVKVDDGYEAYLLIRNKKVCLRGRKKKDLIHFRKINKDSRVTLVCYKQSDNNTIVYYLERMVIREDTLIEVDQFQRSSIASFERMIEYSL